MIQITPEIKAMEPDFLRKARRTGYVCPVCGNGTGEDGDGIKPHGDNYNYHCFRCGFSGDIIDLYGVAKSITEPGEKIRAFAEHYGITDEAAPNTLHECGNGSVRKPTAGDMETYFNECVANNDGSYLAGRGITLETQRRFRVGFDPEWRNPKALATLKSNGRDPESIPGMPAVIIPRSLYSYLARDIRPDNEVPDGKKRFTKQVVGNAELFNPDALKDAGHPVYVVEGEVDAMSVIEAGGSAVALCSTNNSRLLIEWFKVNPDCRPECILALDNDDAGQVAMDSLAGKLEDIGISCTVAEYPHKDPNEFWVSDPDGMRNMIAAGMAKSGYAADIPEQLCTDDALQGGGELGVGLELAEDDESMLDMLFMFHNPDAMPREYTVKTGFKCFDGGVMDKGMGPGLSIIGGIPSSGKTTFSGQLGDQIARLGTPVMYFSGEPTRKELAVKSISRETFNFAGLKRIMYSDGHSEYLAREYEWISHLYEHGDAPKEIKAVVDAAIDRYELYAGNLFVYDLEKAAKDAGNPARSLSVPYIECKVKGFVERTGRKPFVIVDFLQVLEPASQTATEKQNLDKAVNALKGIATRHGIHVFVISSFNRLNYAEPISMSAFNGSGGIEYAADYLFGLQQYGMDYTEEDLKNSISRKARIAALTDDRFVKGDTGEPVRMLLKVLKNRNGACGEILFDAYPKFNCFREVGVNRPSGIGTREGSLPDRYKQ